MKNKLYSFLKYTLTALIVLSMTKLPDVSASSASVVSATYQVTDYGANGSDSADDYSAIQQCLNFGKDNSQMIEVKIPAGNYHLSKCLTIYSNTILTLDSKAVIIRDNEENCMMVTERNTDIGGYGQASNITVQGGTWNGNTRDTTVLSSLLRFDHATNITLQNCTVKNACTRHMVIFAGVNQATVSNVTISDVLVYTGDDPDSYYMTEGSDEGTGTDALMRPMEALHFDCITSDNVSEPDIYPLDDTPCKNVTVTNCTFSDVISGVGGHVADAKIYGSNIVIKNNTFKNVKYTCIDTYCHNNIEISGNTATNVGELARITNCTGTVKSNTLTCTPNLVGTITGDLNLYGIFSTGSELTVSGNTFQAVMTNGISAVNGSDVTATGNTLNSCGLNGIYFSESKGSATGNKVSKPGSIGICAVDSTVTSINSNQISAPGSDGVYARNSTVSAIQSNTIASPGGRGVSISQKSTVTSVKSNQISSAKGHGIYVNAATATLQQNTVNGCTENGISTAEAAKVTVTGNTIKSAKGNGIYLKDSTGTVSSNTITGPAKAGISLVNATSAKVDQNQISSPAAQGIITSGSKVTAMQSNTITKPATLGIGIYDGSTVTTLASNKVTSSSKYGIYVRKSKATVKSNTVTGSKDSGIVVAESSTAAVQSNTVSSAGNYGILFNTSKGSAEKNKVSGAGSTGIEILSSSNSKSSPFSVSGNTVTGSAGIGIRANASTYVTIDSNQVTSAGSNGVAAYYANNCTISGNTVTGSKKYGIAVNFSKTASVQGNKVSGSASYDICINDSSTGKMASNTFGSNGIYVYNTSKFSSSDRMNLSSCTATVKTTSYVYTGSAKTPGVAVKNGAKTLVKGTDYTCTYSNNVNAGTAKVIIKGKGLYAGSITKTFKITKAAQKISANNVTKVTSSKQARTFTVTVKAKDNAKLTYTSDTPSVTMASNRKVTIKKNYVGKATITIKAAATKNYKAATKKITITVNPEPVKLTQAVNKKGQKLALKWSRNSKATGYEIQYSTDSKFKKADTIQVKKNSSVTRTLSKLTKNKTYYVRVRTYKTVSKKNYYSTWSDAKKIKITK